VTNVWFRRDYTHVVAACLGIPALATVSFAMTCLTPMSILIGEDFLYGFKPGRHGPDAPPLAPASARCRWRSAGAPGGWRVTRGCGCAVVVEN